MFDRVFRVTAREAIRRLTIRRGAARSARLPTLLPGLETRPTPMRPVQPPAAVNDNPLAALEVEVERELRARGYLR